MTPIAFESAVVALTEAGMLSIALMDGLDPPHQMHRTCVGIIICPVAAALDLIKQIGSALAERET